MTPHPLRRFVAAMAAAAVATLGAGTITLTSAVQPAVAAAATVGNGITTSDLTTIGVTPDAIASALVGPGVTVSNVIYSGAPAQAGLLHVVDPAVVSFNDGIILSSGYVADVVGPNKSDGITGDMAGPDDPDLTTLIQNTLTVNPMTYDAVVLEFDFVPTASEVYFTYTFASDEYLEWVNLFNDVFAFYVNGVNCATVPSGEPVSIDTINSVVHPELFRDNSFSSPPANPINIESDGLSVEMICAAPVIAGQSNHMKLALADTSDQILDSVVMIKAHSLSTTPPESCNDHVDNDDDLLVDMDDDSCTGTTTPPPPGGSGIGDSSSSPPFTGNEGTPILLDASALGWTASAETLTTSWTVTGINGTAGTCAVSPSTPLPLEADGSIAVVTATCPNEGEYVARVDGWDIEGKSSFDTDVDFFVHNAPPAVEILTPAGGVQIDDGTTLALAASVVDPGTFDSVTCEVSWGDGATTIGVLAAEVCTAEHTYVGEGTYLLSVTATDDAGDSSAAAMAVEVTAVAPPPNTPPSADAGGPFSGVEGSAIAIVGSASDLDGDAITTSWSVVPAGQVDPGASCVVAEPWALATTVTCNDDGPFVLSLTADDGQAVTISGATLAVGNVAPTVTITNPAADPTLATGDLLGVTAAVADAGANDSLSCTVAWGDGALSSGAVTGGVCSASHAYTIAGQALLTVTVTDDDATTADASRQVTVVAPVPAPTIGQLKPTSGKVGTAVTLRGTNLAGATEVRFGGTAAVFTVLSDTRISAVVPTGATTGPVTVTTPGGTAASAGVFTVIVPAPKISGFTPGSGPAGTVVTITGSNLAGATAVTFGGTVAAYTVVSPTTIAAIVPTGAPTGRIRVTTPGGTATSKKNFVVS